MDDIQVWIYILFGIIYVITRALKKKRPENLPPPTEDGDGAPRRREAKSFEELLREFTEAGVEEEEEVNVPRQESKPTPAPRRPVEAKMSESERFEQEGETRHFADDESRKIYEASIRQAEATPIAYERDEHFKISSKSLDRTTHEKTGDNKVAEEIREILSSPGSARKAVILSEIFNRKY